VCLRHNGPPARPLAPCRCIPGAVGQEPGPAFFRPFPALVRSAPRRCAPLFDVGLAFSPAALRAIPSFPASTSASVVFPLALPFRVLLPCAGCGAPLPLVFRGFVAPVRPAVSCLRLMRAPRRPAAVSRLACVAREVSPGPALFASCGWSPVDPAAGCAPALAAFSAGGPPRVPPPLAPV